MMYSAVGKLVYSDEPKVFVEVDEDLVRMARWFIPPAQRPRQQRYPAHISVVRNEVIAQPSAWRKHEGERVAFVYNSMAVHDEVYWWLRVFSMALLNLRLGLGLPLYSQWSRPPDGENCFHITIGNTKKL